MTTMDLIEGVSSQSLGQVFRAELRRLLRQGGLRRAGLVALGLSVLLGVSRCCSSTRSAGDRPMMARL